MTIVHLTAFLALKSDRLLCSVLSLLFNTNQSVQVSHAALQVLNLLQLFLGNVAVRFFFSLLLLHFQPPVLLLELANLRFNLYDLPLQSLLVLGILCA